MSMPESPTPLLSYYARRAPEYDAIYAKPERQEDLRCLEALLQEAVQGKVVLELAAGTGYWTQFLARTAAHVTATDLSIEVLDVARSRVERSSPVDFQLADAYRPDQVEPPHVGPFDAVFAGFWWSHIPRQRLPAFLRTLHDCQQPGTRMLFIDNRYVEGSSTAIARRDEDGNTYQLRRLTDGSEHEVLKNFPAPDELREGAEEAGGVCVEVEALEYFWTLEYAAI